MQEITKAFWDMAGKENRRKCKDGTRLLRFKIPGTNDTKWVPVFWKR